MLAASIACYSSHVGSQVVTSSGPLPYRVLFCSPFLPHHMGICTGGICEAYPFSRQQCNSEQARFVHMSCAWRATCTACAQVGMAGLAPLAGLLPGSLILMLCMRLRWNIAARTTIRHVQARRPLLFLRRFPVCRVLVVIMFFSYFRCACVRVCSNSIHPVNARMYDTTKT